MFVVSAAEMASPFILGSGAIPHPSWTLRFAVSTSALDTETSAATYMRQTLFLTWTMLVDVVVVDVCAQVDDVRP